MRQISRMLKQKPLKKITPSPIIALFNQDFCHLITSATPRSNKFYSKTQMGHMGEILRVSAAEGNSGCLSCNQIGKEMRALVVNNKIGQLAEQTTIGQPHKLPCLHDQYSNPQDYSIYFHPKLLKGSHLTSSIQQSISLPFMQFQVRRYTHIQIQYRDSNNQRLSATVQGGYARMFQQSFQQLGGRVMLDWRINHGHLGMQKHMIQYFPKCTSILQQYSTDLKKTFKQYPKLIEMKQQINFEVDDYLQQKQIISFSEDYMRRLMKHYVKEMNLLTQRINSGALSDLPSKYQKNNKIEVQIINKK